MSIVTIWSVFPNPVTNDGRSYVLQITSVYLYKFCVDQQLLLHSSVLNSHTNVRLEVSHKEKLNKVTG